MKPEDIIKPENLVFKKTDLLFKPTSYCPGCGHGTVHRMILEIIEEMDILSDTICVAPVGCAVLMYEFINIDCTQVAHGRAPAAATGIKRLWPEKFVFTYQGDGDLAAIGTAETIHACNRGENITIVYINNGIYGMTGGQMAPTTLEGMKASTCPYGRDVENMGNPIDMSWLVAQLPGTYYVTRQSVHKPANVRRTKKALRKGFENQKLNKGTSIIEVVTNCNTNWKMSPVQSNQWLEENMLKQYPLGDIKLDGVLLPKENKN